jgi:tetratricopeptide (TPR) repeat protein
VLGVEAESLRGTALSKLGRTAESVEAWLRGGEEALQLGWWAGANALFTQALAVAFQAGSLDLAARAAEGVRTVLETRGEGEALAAAVQNLGSVSVMRGDLPGALRHLDEALSRYELLGHGADVAEIRSLRSWVLGELGDFRAALDEQRALALYFADHPRDAAWADNQLMLGVLRYRLGDEAGAADALTGALQAFQDLGELQSAADAQGNLGLTHAMGGRWSEAFEAYRASLVLSEALGNALGAALARHNMADALQMGADAEERAAALSADAAERTEARVKAQGDLARARALMDEALPILREAGAASLTCAATHTLGKILLSDGRPREALALLEPVRDEATRLRSWQTSVLATATLAEARLQLGDWPGALREARLAADELSRAFSGLAEADLARARALTPDVFDIGVSAAVQTKSVDDLAWFLEAGRASALLRGLGGRAAALRATVPQPLMERLGTRTRAKVAAFAAWQEARTLRRPETRGLWTEYEARRAEEQQALEETQRVQAEAANRRAVAPDLDP